MIHSEGTPFDTYPEPEPVGATDPGDLTLPLYGATFGQALSRFFRSYARFSGRASRSEFWWVMLTLGIVAVVCGMLAGAAEEDSTLGLTFLVILLILTLACAVPGWALLVRRLHDADLSGWLSLLTVLPYIGFVIQIVFGVLPSKHFGERFDRR